MIVFIIAIKNINGETMDLRILNTFIQVAELGSFTRAAERLSFSQPTVSFQIKQLEEELGVQLFDRIGHTVTLTDGGRAALEYAQNILRTSDEMISEVSSQRQPEGLVRIAMADSLCAPLMLGCLADMRREYPLVSLKVMTAGTAELFRLLDHNEVDLVCTLDSHIFGGSYVISDEEKVGVHFVCSAKSPLTTVGEVTLDRLMGEPFLLTEKGMSYRRLLDEHLARLSLEIEPTLELSSAHLLCQLVSEGEGVSFLPDYVTEDAVATGRLVRLSVKDVEVELWKQIIYRRDKWLSAPMRAVIGRISSVRLGNF